MKILSLFDGISCGMQAFKELNIPIETYYASEIDKYAIEISRKNHPEIIQLGDVENWREWDIDWDNINMLIGGSPCQGFTFAGKRLNFEDHRSKLFFVYYEILQFLREKNPNILFFLENVKMDKKCKDAIDELIGVNGIPINSNLFSAQNRDRIYWTNIPIKELPTENNITIRDIINPSDNENVKTFVSKEHHAAWLKTYKWKHNDLDGKSKPLLATYYKQPPHCPYIIYREELEGEEEINNKYSIYRRLSPIECERLQTLPDNYTLVVNDKSKENSYTQRWKTLGNGWTVETIKHIFSSLT